MLLQIYFLDILSFSLKSLLGLKHGTNLSETRTISPDLGLRAVLEHLLDMKKLPNPRISIRFPEAKQSSNTSSITFTARSKSLTDIWSNLLYKAFTKSFFLNNQASLRC